MTREKTIPEGLRRHQTARRQKTLDALLDAAADLFIAQGYRGTSMQQLAKAAGVSPATMYKAFASKEDLLHQMVERELARARGPFHTGVPEFASAREAASFIANQLVTVMTETRIPGLTRLAMAEHQDIPGLGSVLATPEGEDQTQAIGELVFKELIRRGLFRDCDASIAVRQFLGMINQAVFFHVMAHGSPIQDLETYIDACVKVFCDTYGA